MSSVIASGEVSVHASIGAELDKELLKRMEDFHNLVISTRLKFMVMVSNEEEDRRQWQEHAQDPKTIGESEFGSLRWHEDWDFGTDPTPAKSPVEAGKDVRSKQASGSGRKKFDFAKLLRNSKKNDGTYTGAPKNQHISETLDSSSPVFLDSENSDSSIEAEMRRKFLIKSLSLRASPRRQQRAPDSPRATTPKPSTSFAAGNVFQRPFSRKGSFGSLYRDREVSSKRPFRTSSSSTLIELTHASHSEKKPEIQVTPIDSLDQKDPEPTEHLESLDSSSPTFIDSEPSESSIEAETRRKSLLKALSLRASPKRQQRAPESPRATAPKPTTSYATGNVFQRPFSRKGSFGSLYRDRGRSSKKPLRTSSSSTLIDFKHALPSEPEADVGTQQNVPLSPMHEVFLEAAHAVKSRVMEQHKKEVLRISQPDAGASFSRGPIVLLKAETASIPQGRVNYFPTRRESFDGIKQEPQRRVNDSPRRRKSFDGERKQEPQRRVNESPRRWEWFGREGMQEPQGRVNESPRRWEWFGGRESKQEPQGRVNESPRRWEWFVRESKQEPQGRVNESPRRKESESEQERQTRETDSPIRRESFDGIAESAENNIKKHVNEVIWHPTSPMFDGDDDQDEPFRRDLLITQDQIILVEYLKQRAESLQTNIEEDGNDNTINQVEVSPPVANAASKEVQQDVATPKVQQVETISQVVSAPASPFSDIRIQQQDMSAQVNKIAQHAQDGSPNTTVTKVQQRYVSSTVDSQIIVPPTRPVDYERQSSGSESSRVEEVEEEDVEDDKAKCCGCFSFRSRRKRTR